MHLFVYFYQSILFKFPQLPQHSRFHHQAARIARQTDEESNEKCSAETLEKLSTFNLAKAANFSDHCSIVAKEIFARRSASETVELLNAEPASMEVFKHFGHLITKLSLRFDRQKAAYRQEEIGEFRKLLQSVNKNSRKLLVEFAIHYTSNCYLDIFEDIKGPFERAETVSIEFSNLVVHTNNVRLNTTFPHVRHLELDYDQVTHPYFVDCQYADLETLSVTGILLNESEEIIFRDILRQNQNIRSLSLKNPTQPTLTLVNQNLPNLEELHIYGSINEDEWDDGVNFESIKKLEIRFQTHKCSMPQHIEFNPDLEHLLLHCLYSEIGDDYFAFLDNFSQVKNLTAGVEFNHEHLEKLTGKFPELLIADFGVRNDVTAEDIAEFIDESEHLLMLTFLYISNPNAHDFAEQLGALIGEDFNIQFKRSPASTVYFLVERKPPGDNGVKVLASSTFIFLSVLFTNNLHFF